MEDSLRDLWENIKCTNIRIIGVPEEEEKKKGADHLFEEIMAENFPNLVKEIDVYIQEAQIPPNKINQKRLTQRGIIYKMSKVKDKKIILQQQEKNNLLPTRESLIRLPADFSAETLQARREWRDIFK